MVEIVRFSSRPSRAWANGGGTTRVLLDDGGQRDGEWTYRVSVADLAGRQPFSRFDGVDRSLTFLGPGTLRMTVNGVRTPLAPWEEIRFAGEDEVVSDPTDPPARDLNVMVRRHALALSTRRTAASTRVDVPRDDSAVWISFGPRGTVDDHTLEDLDLAVLPTGGQARIEGPGLLCHFQSV